MGSSSFQSDDRTISAPPNLLIVLPEPPRAHRQFPDILWGLPDGGSGIQDAIDIQKYYKVLMFFAHLCSPFPALAKKQPNRSNLSDCFSGSFIFIVLIIWCFYHHSLQSLSYTSSRSSSVYDDNHSLSTSFRSAIS